MELKECRRRMACPYSSVLCPPLCAACRGRRGGGGTGSGKTYKVLTVKERWSPRSLQNHFHCISDLAYGLPTSGAEGMTPSLRRWGRGKQLLRGGAMPVSTRIRSCNQPFATEDFFCTVSGGSRIRVHRPRGG